MWQNVKELGFWFLAAAVGELRLMFLPSSFSLVGWFRPSKWRHERSTWHGRKGRRVTLVPMLSDNNWHSLVWNWTECDIWGSCHRMVLKSFILPSHCTLLYYYYYNRLTTLCLGLLRWVSTRRVNHSGFCWSRDDGVALASAEPYASYLHFAPEDNHASTSSVRFLWAGCPSWHLTNSIKALIKALINKQWNIHSTLRRINHFRFCRSKR